MKAFSSEHFAKRARALSRAMAVLVSLTGMVVLAGWVLHIGVLKSVVPGLIEMKANTALGLLLAGLALLAVTPSSGLPTILGRRVSMIFALVVALLGVLTLGEHVMGWDLGIDQLLFHDTADVAPPYFPGRMAPLTAIDFVFVGLALVLVDRGGLPGRLAASEWLTALAAATSVQVIFGYLFGAESLVKAPNSTSMALHTAIAFLLLAASMLCARPQRMLMARLGSEGDGGALARRLLPAAIVLPAVLVWLGVVGERLGLYSKEHGHAIETSASVLIYCALIMFAAGALGRTDIARKRSQQALRDAEEKYRSIFEHASEGIYQTTPDGQFIAANPAMARIFGYDSPRELMAHLTASTSYATSDSRVEFQRRLAADGHVDDLESEIVCKDGRRRWISESARAVRNGGDQIRYYEGTIRDVTDRKRARQALMDSERLLLEAQSIAGLGSYVLDIPTGRWTSSAVLDDIFGIDARHDRTIDAWVELVHADERNEMRRYFAEDVLGRRARFDREYRIVRARDGAFRWVHGLGEVEYDAGGQPLRMIGTITDITGRRQKEDELRLFRALIDHSSDGIEVVDPETLRFIDINDRTCRDLGYTRDELLTMSVYDVDPEFKRTDRGRVVDNIGESGHALFESTHRRKDGSTFPVEINVARLTLGRPYQIVVVRDITARKSAEASLRLQAAALNAAANAIVITDREGTIEWVNAALTASVGYEAAEVVGQNPRDLFKSGAHDRAFYKQLWDTVLAGRVWRGEMVNRRKNGSLYIEDMTITPITDAHGAVTHFVAIKLDITDMKRTEDQLREQAELLDHAQDAIIVSDLGHRITYWNKSAERIYGWTAEEAISQTFPDVFCRNRDRFGQAQHGVLANGEWSGELLQTRKGGGTLTVQSRWTLVRDPTGAPKSVLMINTDITEQKHLELQFLRAQRLESIGTLAGGIAHDLNNVLSPIVMSIDLLKLKVADADGRALVDTIGTSAQRGSDMVRQVLSFARGLEGRRVEVQVRHLIREMEKIARETFPKDIRVHTAASRDLWTVVGDPTQLHQVLLNLCINARDAMPEGGEILIAADNVTIDAQEAAATVGAEAGPHVVIEVKDTGTGIPQSIIDKIFDPFFTTKEVGKGTGLGLSTSLTIVKQHGGFVRVLSEPGIGTRFRVCLPAQVERREAAPDVDAAELPHGNGETVLVVDDEAAIREITRQTLEAFGYKVLLASDGSEAVSLYAQHGDDIAVAIVDMMMPGMDGASAIQVLAKMNPAVRIIAVSGRAAASQKLPAGVAAIQFLPKPISAEALLQALRTALSSDGPGSLRLFE